MRSPEQAFGQVQFAAAQFPQIIVAASLLQTHLEHFARLIETLHFHQHLAVTGVCVRQRIDAFRWV